MPQHLHTLERETGAVRLRLGEVSLCASPGTGCEGGPEAPHRQELLVRGVLVLDGRPQLVVGALAQQRLQRLQRHVP